MRAVAWSLSLLATFSSFGVGEATINYHAKRQEKIRSLREKRAQFVPPRPRHQIVERSNLIPEALNVSKYAVDGKKIPDVDFDIGESYAGLMPIGANMSGDRQLWFWFFPSSNPLAKDEITIWLNGGPGCSSLEGFLQENGPVLWQYGTFKPVPNPYSWVNLTNMIWVEQPVGTGFTKGNRTVNTNEEMVAADFLGFFKNFIDTFGLHNKKIFISGESYAGYYVPYIADAMLNKNDTKYYNLDSVLLYDPSISPDPTQTDLVVVPFVDHHANLFNFNRTFNAHLHKQAESCGYTKFFNKYLTFPPPGPIPPPPNNTALECRIFNEVFDAISHLNPCFDIYQIATTCPLLWDVLGYPGSLPYLPAGASVYFNRTEVQKAINAPVQIWEECSSHVLDIDTSPPSGLSVLPRVIDRAKRTIIVHGTLDMVLIGNGTLLGIQNMTWGGKQGFQKAPASDLYVPYHYDYSLSTLAGEGIMGVTHTERKLTWVDLWLSGHMVPQYAPSAAYRQVEFMLGRVKSLSEVSSFTTQYHPWNDLPANNASVIGRGAQEMTTF